MKAGSTSWSQDTMMETTALAIGDHRRWLRHGAMRIGSTWSDDGSRSRALQGDGKWGLAAMAKIAGQRMSAETKQQELWSMPEGPVSEPDMHMRKYDRVVAKPSPNASAIPRGVRGEEVAERRDARSMSEAHA